jgi:hypothetical protein
MAKKNETTKKVTLDARVRKIAENGSGKGIGMPNWFSLPQNKDKRLLHIDICKKLAEMSNKYGNYPITYLVYFAVGKNAHRVCTFLGGYDKFNEKKAETIFSWLKLFAKYHKNEKLFKNPNVAHALCRFYDKYSTKTKDFKAAMESMECNPKINVKNAKAIVEGLGIAKEPKVEVTELDAALAPTNVEVATE